MNAVWLPDKTPVRSPYNRIACGLIGADVRTDWSPQTKTMSGWIKIRVEFIKGLAGQWKGSSHPKTPSETMDTVAEEAPGADSIALQPESQISITCEASPNQQEIERRRKIVRQFFNDFWISTDDKPRTFAERLNRAEDHINEQLAARGETWQLDATTRKQLGLPVRSKN